MPNQIFSHTFAQIAICLAILAIRALDAQAADEVLKYPDLSGQWGRDMIFFEPPASGPGPVVNTIRKADGTIVARDRCCEAPRGMYLGDYTNPILKPEAAEAVKKFGDLLVSGRVLPDLHNSCWPEPPPFVMAVHFGVLIVPRRDEVTFVYLLHNTVRHVRLNASHPENLTPSWQGHSVGWYEGDTLVIDTVGIKVSPLSSVDGFGTPHSKALHVVERYRLIDGEAAAEAQRKHAGLATLAARLGLEYGRGIIDPDTTKKGLQVEFTVEDPGVFTTPWSGRVTYRRVIGDWPEAICAENPFFLGSGAAMPTAHMPDF
jgi:hypothetical protein